MEEKNKEVKRVLDLLIDGMGVVIEAEADGKVTIADAGLLMKLVPDLGPAFAGIGSVPSELSAMSVEDAQDLESYVIAKVGVGSVHARALLDKSLKAAIALYAVAEELKKPSV